MIKLTITQKTKDENELVLFSQSYERESEKEILDIIKTFSDLSRNYSATYLNYKIEAQ